VAAPFCNVVCAVSACWPRFMTFMQVNIITAQGETTSSGTSSATESQWLAQGESNCGRGYRNPNDEAAPSARPTGRALASTVTRGTARRLEW
jgi:hypothetical protein